MLLTIFSAVASADEIQKFDLKSLHGEWAGTGEFLIPITGGRMDISGEAIFIYQPERKRLKTSLIGEKFFFKYTDSGYLWVDPVTDTISWEVWDNSGKHALYHGKVEGNAVTGSRLYKKDIYDILIKQVTTDSIDFRLIITEPDGDRYDKAIFYLRRIDNSSED